MVHIYPQEEPINTRHEENRTNTVNYVVEILTLQAMLTPRTYVCHDHTLHLIM